MEIRALLETSSLFRDLPRPLLDRLAAGSYTRAIPRGETLFNQGDKAQSIFVVLTGRLRLVQHTLDGRDVTMNTFAPGDPIGLVVALTGESYPGSAEVIEDCAVLGVPGEVMWQVMHEHGPLAVRVLRIVADRLHEAQNRIRELSAERVQQRVARALLRLAQQVGVKEPDGSIRLDLRLSRQDIAQLSGTTLETVSRTLTAWERDKIIDARREQILILNRFKLFGIAEDMGHT